MVADERLKPFSDVSNLLHTDLVHHRIVRPKDVIAGGFEPLVRIPPPPVEDDSIPCAVTKVDRSPSCGLRPFTRRFVWEDEIATENQETCKGNRLT